jgi:Domain of unknown function (DUF1918)
MMAKAGDQLLTASGSTALILDVVGADGHPPYIVKWTRSGHIAMFSPDQYTRVVPAGLLTNAEG